jgi:hypothetical protein
MKFEINLLVLRHDKIRVPDNLGLVSVMTELCDSCCEHEIWRLFDKKFCQHSSYNFNIFFCVYSNQFAQIKFNTVAL